jgi:hypothetical protein
MHTALRKPGLKATSPERLEFMLAASEIVARLVSRGRVSVRDLALWWQCPASHAAEKIKGERPIHLGEVMALPDRFADDVLDEARMVVRARRLAV